MIAPFENIRNELRVIVVCREDRIEKGTKAYSNQLGPILDPRPALRHLDLALHVQAPAASSSRPANTTFNGELISCHTQHSNFLFRCGIASLT
jgi:hypothetical protein